MLYTDSPRHSTTTSPARSPALSAGLPLRDLPDQGAALSGQSEPPDVLPRDVLEDDAQVALLRAWRSRRLLRRTHGG